MDIKFFTLSALASAAGTLLVQFLTASFSFLKTKLLKWLEPPNRNPG